MDFLSYFDGYAGSLALSAVIGFSVGAAFFIKRSQLILSRQRLEAAHRRPARRC